MMLELNRALFQRLVKLYLITFVVTVIAVTAELFFSPGWEFSDAFDRLASDYFDPAISADIWMPVGALVVLAHVVGAFGLLRVKKWSRTLFVWPILVFTILDVAVRSPPMPMTPLMIALTFVGSALFGAIVLMAYSREHGAKWLENDHAGPLPSGSA